MSDSDGTDDEETVPAGDVSLEIAEKFEELIEKCDLTMKELTAFHKGIECYRVVIRGTALMVPATVRFEVCSGKIVITQTTRMSHFFIQHVGEVNCQEDQMEEYKPIGSSQDKWKSSLEDIKGLPIAILKSNEKFAKDTAGVGDRISGLFKKKPAKSRAVILVFDNDPAAEFIPSVLEKLAVGYDHEMKVVPK